MTDEKTNPKPVDPRYFGTVEGFNRSWSQVEKLKVADFSAEVVEIEPGPLPLGTKRRCIVDLNGEFYGCFYD